MKRIFILLSVVVFVFMSLNLSYAGVASSVAEYDGVKKFPAVSGILSLLVLPGLGNVYAYSMTGDLNDYFSSEEKSEYRRKMIFNFCFDFFMEAALTGLSAGIYFGASNQSIGALIGCWMWPMIYHLIQTGRVISLTKKFNKIIAGKIDEKQTYNNNDIRQVKVIFPIMGMKF